MDPVFSPWAFIWGQRSLRAPFCSWGNRQKAWHVLLEEQKFQRLLELDICSFLQKHMCDALNYLPGNASGTGRWSRPMSLPPQTIYSSRGGRQSASKQINVFFNFRYDKGYEEKWSSERINCWRRGCFGGGPLSSDFLNFLKAGRAVVPERVQNQANRVLPYLSFSRNSTDHFLNGWPVEPLLGSDSLVNVIVPMSFRDLNEVSERAMHRSEGRAFQEQ